LVLSTYDSAGLHCELATRSAPCCAFTAYRTKHCHHHESCSSGKRLAESHLTLKGRSIPFVNQVKYLTVIFDMKITRRYHTEMIEAKGFRTFIRVYSLLKSERLSASIKLTLHKALIRSTIDLSLPRLGT
jgi:hypothetical protein